MYKKIVNMIKESANYQYDMFAREWRACYDITPSWVTDKPLSLEDCPDYNGNEAVYDWMLEKGIIMLKFEDGKFRVRYDNEY